MTVAEAVHEAASLVRDVAALSDPVVIPLGQWNRIREAVEIPEQLLATGGAYNARALIHKGD